MVPLNIFDLVTIALLGGVELLSASDVLLVLVGEFWSDPELEDEEMLTSGGMEGGVEFPGPSSKPASSMLGLMSILPGTRWTRRDLSE